MSSIDLNSDLGEGDAYDEELLRIVSSCNVACGGHAGDAQSMAATVRCAIGNGVCVGAHPGYPDREGFGRVSGFLGGNALYESLTEQVTSLADIAGQLGARLTHVKAHGALYNDAVANSELADIIARVTAEAPGSPAFMGMANTELQHAAEPGVDFAVPSPVLPTQSHPGAPTPGWEQFSELCIDLPMPACAPGGMRTGMIRTAMNHSARGVALPSGIW